MIYVIEGNIGVGKSSYIENFKDCVRLTERFDIGILDLYYGNKEKYAFATQLSFVYLNYINNLNAVQEAIKTGKDVILDRSFLGVKVFSAMLLKSNLLSLQEYDCLVKTLYKLEQEVLDLAKSNGLQYKTVVLLNSDFDYLISNIHRRGRENEMEISKDYLSSIHDQYMSSGYKCIEYDYKRDSNKSLESLLN